MPWAPSTPRGIATHGRILDAATEEFAERGLAGARMERITAAAKANKAQVYSYFHNKEGLFDAVVARCIEDTTDDVAFDPDDLPSWAVALYDRHLRQPELTRLIAWTRLERRPTGRWFETDRYGPKFAAIRRAQEAGRLRSGDPFDLLVLIIAMASAWSPASSVYTATADEPEAVHQQRRELLREGVARVCTP